MEEIGRYCPELVRKHAPDDREGQEDGQDGERKAGKAHHQHFCLLTASLNMDCAPLPPPPIVAVETPSVST